MVRLVIAHDDAFPEEAPAEPSSQGAKGRLSRSRTGEGWSETGTREYHPATFCSHTISTVRKAGLYGHGRSTPPIDSIPHSARAEHPAAAQCGALHRRPEPD